MIKLNLASTPGIQYDEIPVKSQIIEDIPEKEKINVQEEFLEKQEVVEETTSSEEFIPNSTSVASSSEDDSGKGNNNIIRNLVIFIIILAFFSGGYYIIQNFDTLFKSNSKEQISVVDTSEIIDTVETEIAMSAKSIEQKDEITAENINTILIGKNILFLTKVIFENFDPGLILDYLRINQEKVSFIVYYSSDDRANFLQKNLKSSIPNLKNDLFYVEKSNLYKQNPFQVMGFFNLNQGSYVIEERYIHYDDEKMAKHLGFWAAQEGIELNPVKIFTKDTTKIRKVEITGKGNATAIIGFIEKLLDENINLAIKNIHFKNKQKIKFDDLLINLKIEARIYPRK